jgi:secreted PhoX family phosphatase
MHSMTTIRRRELLASGAAAAGFLALGPSFWGTAFAAPATVGAGPYGPLQPVNEHGLQLPDGFRSRVVATGRQAVDGTSYVWHTASDGQAAFAEADGGWILVSNSETIATAGGGCSSIRFAPDGTIRGAQRIASTSINCAGGPTPSGTWLTCGSAIRSAASPPSPGPRWGRSRTRR